MGRLAYRGKQGTMETTGQVVNVVRPHEGAVAIIDVVGVGAGVYDRLAEQGIEVVAYNGAKSAAGIRDASGQMEFVNLKSASWWGMRERLDPETGDNLALPPDDILTGDLTAPRWTETSTGKIKVESKEDLKKRLGRSPDAGDAVVMAYSPAVTELLFR